MSGRKAKLFAVVFALVFNVAGGPMTWARMATPLESADTSSVQATEHCPGRAASEGQGDSDQSPERRPSCCSGGSCSCGCLPAVLAVVPPDTRMLLVLAPEVLSAAQAIPAETLEDPLRPPIS
jgi:hypothetical protein